MSDSPKNEPDPVDKSLGDQATSDDALSSISDLSGDLSDDLGDAMPLVDLSERYEIQEPLGKGGMGDLRTERMPNFRIGRSKKNMSGNP